MRLIVKNLNLLRSILNAINTSFEVKEIVEAAGDHLPSLFQFSVLGVLWKESSVLYLYQEESCPPAFTQQVVENMLRVFSLLGEKPVEPNEVSLEVEKRKLRPSHMIMDPKATLKSYLILPLSIENEIIGMISLNSEQPNAFDAQDLQFFSVIGYQMAATLKHFQRFSSVKSMAVYDTLTSLYNRRYFDERLVVETQKAFYGGSALSLVMVDIDHFKRINDTFGHTEGDKVLKEIALLLKASVRKKDTVSRYGGEEFVLILPDAGLEEAVAISERIRRLVEQTLFDVGKAKIHVTVSLGIANSPSHRARTKEDLVRMADQALYDAKRGGRNRVCIYSPH
ncbi:MAG: diguanylate cyclase [Desulfobacterota bacterium]|nr:diguanylate cyclase [Thermodesulfobacteriota bacterium]